MKPNDLTKIVDSSANVANAATNIFCEIADRFFPYRELTKRALDVYISEIEKTDKPKEYKAWEILNAKKEFRKLKNIENISDVAQQYCNEKDDVNASYDEHESWYDFFFENAGNISDHDIQMLWGKVLANVINGKGEAPRSVLRILSFIDSQTAISFSELCKHKLMMVALDKENNVIPNSFLSTVCIFKDNEYYKRKGLTLEVMNELESLGLICTNDTGYTKSCPNAVKMLISDGNFTECIRLKNNAIYVGEVMLTNAGEYLFMLISNEYENDQYEIMKKYYLDNGFEFEATNLRIVRNGEKFSVIAV